MPEIKLILFFLSKLQNSENLRAPSDLNSIDWDLFVDLSIRHKVLMLIFQSLMIENQISVPKVIKDKLKKIYRINLMRNISVSSNLIQIVNMLDNNRIISVPFKGAVLSEFVYHDPMLRQFADLDLLISKKDAQKTINLFLKTGYELKIDLKQDQFKNYVKFKKSIEIKEKKSDIWVDLHWEFTGNYSIKPFELEYVRNRLVQINFLNQKVSHLAKADLLACLCLHGCKNIWDNLESIFCIALVFETFNTGDIERLCDISSEKHCKKAVGLALFLCIHFFKIELTDTMKNHLFIYPDLKKISLPIIQKLTLEKHPPINIGFRFSKFNLDVRDSLVDKIQYVLRMLFIPSFVDWNNNNFPNQFPILYFFARPTRLIKRYLSQVLHKL